MLLVFATAAAATWTVEPDGRGDFETLAEAATVVVTGDTVIVGDGTWAGATFSSRVTVRGKNGSGSTTIDGAGVAALTGWAGLDGRGGMFTIVPYRRAILSTGNLRQDYKFVGFAGGCLSIGSPADRARSYPSELARRL